MKTKFKKIVLPAFVASASMYISILFFLGAVCGFLFGKYVAGGEVGQPGRIKSIRFSLGRYIIHLHHWFYIVLSMLIVFISGATYFFPIFVLGFGGGFAFQGIYCYDDWRKIIIKKQH